jgi:hypothetical protein
LLANVLFGLILYSLINSQRVSKAITNRKPQTLFTATIFFTSSVIYLSGFNSIICLISLVASIIVVSNYKINNKVVMGLLPVAVIAMLENGDRFAVIFVLTVLIVPKIKNWKLPTVLMAIGAALMIMVFVLQPLRYGISPLEFSNSTVSLYSVIKHLEGNYTAAYRGLYTDLGGLELLAQQLPFARYAFGYGSLPDMLSSQIIVEAYESGIRVGTNSTVNFSLLGVIISIFSVLFFRACTRIKAQVSFGNALIWYLFIFAPYAFRRTLSAAFFDILLILILVVFLELVAFTVVKIGASRKTQFENIATSSAK